MDPIQDKAREIGRLLVQTAEYQALKRANARLADDRETVTLLNQLTALEGKVAASLQSGQEPGQEEQDEYERLLDQLQRRPIYRELAGAQSSFEQIMVRVNEEIARGIEAGEQSRIILP